MLFALSSQHFQSDRVFEAWTHARAKLVRLGVPHEAWPRHATPHLICTTYLLRSPLDRAHCGARPRHAVGVAAAALAEAAAASSARLTKAVAAGGAGQPAAHDEEMLIMMRECRGCCSDERCWIKSLMQNDVGYLSGGCYLRDVNS